MAEHPTETEEDADVFNDDATVMAYLSAPMAVIHQRLDLERECERLASGPGNAETLRAAVVELVAQVRQVRTKYEAARLRGGCS